MVINTDGNLTKTFFFNLQRSTTRETFAVKFNSDVFN